MKRAFVALLLAGTVICRGEQAQEAPVFKNWQECFRFMAEKSHSPTDEDTLFKLAVGSTVDCCYRLNRTTSVFVVELDQVPGFDGSIRGAQGNGDYFLFTRNNDGFRFLGRMSGNLYEADMTNGTPHFTTRWHMSCNEAIETTYEWDGRMFTETKKEDVRYAADGSKEEVTQTNLPPTPGNRGRTTD